MSTSSSSIESFVCVQRDACVMVRVYKLMFSFIVVKINNLYLIISYVFGSLVYSMIDPFCSSCALFNQ